LDVRAQIRDQSVVGHSLPACQLGLPDYIGGVGIDRLPPATRPALVTTDHASEGRNRKAGQESAHVFSGAVATGKRADHRGLLGFGGGRVDDVPVGLPFAMTGDDRQWRGITSCFWPVGMSACHAGYCTTRPPSTRQCASFHRFLCSQPFQRSKCSALCVKGASAGDGARGSLRPPGRSVWSKVRRSLRAREPARHRAALP